MFCKTSFLLAPVLLVFYSAAGQRIEENKPVVTDGIEYGYLIKNEQVKSTNGEEYGRFELILYATNKSGCTKLYAERESFRTGESPNLLATFNCSNANGKRLTSKSGSVRARDFYVNTRVSESGREVARAVKAGYIFSNGETIKTNIIVLVPLGERPVISCMANNLQELR